MRQTDRERAPIYMRRVRAGLTPVSPFDEEMLDQYPMGADVEVKIKRRRSLPQLRLYWAVLHKVAAATDAYPTAERLHEALKLATGHVVPVRSIYSFETMYIPDSIAFANMDQLEFQTYFNKVIELLTRLVGTDPLQWLMTQEDLAGQLRESIRRERAL